MLFKSALSLVVVGAIALALLVADGVLPQGPLDGAIILGELSLDGAIRPVRGVLPSLIAALNAGITRAIVPRANQREAELMTQMEILSFSHLFEIYRLQRLLICCL
jgi:magnesium chelatase family protein